MDLALDSGLDDANPDPEDERLLAEICGLSAAAPEPAPQPVEAPAAPPLPDSVRRAVESSASRLDALAN